MAEGIAVGFRANGRHVLVTGPDGIGKSALYERFRQMGYGVVDADKEVLRCGNKKIGELPGPSLRELARNPTRWDREALTSVFRDPRKKYLFGFVPGMVWDLKHFDEVHYIWGTPVGLKRMRGRKGDEFGATLAHKAVAAAAGVTYDIYMALRSFFDKKVVVHNGLLSTQELMKEIIGK